MNKIWINKQKNNKCILYFSGWAMDENAISHLNADCFDLCLFNNYHTISKLNEREFSAYTEVYVVAWSLGVWVAAQTLGNLNITKAIAINGTLNPINNAQGIPVQIFQSTIDGWNEKNRTRFNMRVMGGLKQYNDYSNRCGTQSIEEQKKELAFLQTQITDSTEPNFKYDLVLIGKNDLIFNPVNQFNYWHNKTTIVEKEMAHYPFQEFLAWNEIIAL